MNQKQKLKIQIETISENISSVRIHKSYCDSDSSRLICDKILGEFYNDIRLKTDLLEKI